jgi:hypothetical protein
MHRGQEPSSGALLFTKPQPAFRISASLQGLNGDTFDRICPPTDGVMFYYHGTYPVYYCRGIRTFALE